MSGSEPHAGTEPAARLLSARPLRPAVVLARYRPLRLSTLARRLTGQSRLARALARLRQFFPEALAEYGPVSELLWYAVLADLLYRIEAEDWFALDWDRLNQAWAQELEAAGDPRFDRLALHLDYVPLRLFGVSTGEISRARCPVTLELLRAMLIESEVPVITAELAFHGDLYRRLSSWRSPERQAAWQRLALIEADPGLYPGLIAHLPELARWACGLSGNPLLDRTIEPDRPGTWVSWDDQAALDRFKAAWPQAKSRLVWGDQLEAWAQADESNLAQLVDFLTGEGPDPTVDLEWNL